MSNEVKACPFCAEEILVAAQKCKHCNSNLNEEAAAVAVATEATDATKSYDVFLLAIPLVGTMLVWFWISGLNLFQSPGSKMALIMVLVILGTGTVAAMEANKVGMTSDRAKGTYSATSWFFIISLLWVVGYPAYLFKRRDFGLKNRLIPGIAVAAMFIGSWMLMNSAIEDKMAEVRASLALLGQ